MALALQIYIIYIFCKKNRMDMNENTEMHHCNAIADRAEDSLFLQMYPHMGILKNN